MKDEIKEILDLRIDCDYKRLSVDEIITLKDYITNLQKYYNDNVNKYEKLIVKYSNLQERIEKAINHINEHQLVYISQYKEMSCFDNHLMDILQGVGKDE